MLKWNDIIDTIREKKISGKVVTMAAALLVLTGLVGLRQSIPTSSTVGDRASVSDHTGVLERGA